MLSSVKLEAIRATLIHSTYKEVYIFPEKCDCCDFPMMIRIETDSLTTPFWECKNPGCKKISRFKCPYCSQRLITEKIQGIVCSQSAGSCKFHLSKKDLASFVITINKDLIRQIKSQFQDTRSQIKGDNTQKTESASPKVGLFKYAGAFSVLLIIVFLTFYLVTPKTPADLKANIKTAPEETVAQDSLKKNQEDKTSKIQNLSPLIFQNSLNLKTDDSKITKTKMTFSGFCHEPSDADYDRAIAYQTYNTLTECLLAGGTLP